MTLLPEDKQHHAQALHLFAIPCIGRTDRYHGGNCEHCCLRGEGLPNTTDGLGFAPNYAGWARVYVQASAPIPARFAVAFEQELTRTDNPAYVRALMHDIATFGVSII